MKSGSLAAVLIFVACAPRPVVPLETGVAQDAGLTVDAGTDAGLRDAGVLDAGPCSSCPHGTWCARDTCVPECAQCVTDGDCVDGGTCDFRGSCVFLHPGCSGPEIESVRLELVGPWTWPQLMELDVGTGRLGRTDAREAPDGGPGPRDGGVVFIDAGAWRTARAWCPFPAVRADDCVFDLPGLDVEVSGGGRTNRFSYYAGASHLPEIDPVIIDTLVQFNKLTADGG